MAFGFRLQKVLEYREQKKKMAQEELSLSQLELLAIQRELTRLEQEEQRLLKFQQNNQHQQLDPLTLFSIDSYRLFLQQCYKTGLQALEKQEKEVEKKRHAVVERWKECKIIGKLKENALNDYFEKEKISEQHFNDEISLYGYIRKER